MNCVTPKTPVEDALALMRRDGYVLMENALTPAQVAELSGAYDRQLKEHSPKPGATRVEVPRILERDPLFEMLMDLPTTFPVARAVIGADIELASGGELDYKLPRTPAYIAWHNDFQWMADVPYPRQNFWVRCTYFLGDVREDTGPFTLLPGTHLKAHACPPDMNETNGQPKFVSGQVGITGAAGSCLINNTEIWHTNSPLTGDLPRRLIMILYKHAWMKPWQQGYETTPEFAARQTDPVRRQLTGGIAWHQDRSHFPAATVRCSEAGKEILTLPQTFSIQTSPAPDTDRREQLLRDGFCRFPNVLTLDLRGRLRAATDRLLDAVPHEQASAVRSQGSMLPVTLDPLFAELIALPAALDALRSLGFARPVYTDGYVISKPAGGPRLFWHYDWFAWEDALSYAVSPPQVFAMYYLSDTTRENGCLRVLPGSHVRHTPLHDRLDAPHSAGLGAATDTDRAEFSDWPGEADVCVRAGDLLIGDARLLHAAHDNKTRERRTLITLWYQPEFDAMPERMQAQMAAKTQPIPEDWPAAAQDLLRPLRARYEGKALPYERTLYRPRKMEEMG